MEYFAVSKEKAENREKESLRLLLWLNLIDKRVAICKMLLFCLGRDCEMAEPEEREVHGSRRSKEEK